MNLFYVALGGFFGALSRMAISYALPFNGGFPVATFLVNCVGSIGFAAFLCTSLSKSTPLKLFVTTGFFGSFTTFSAFSYEAITLVQQKNWFLSLSYVFSTILVSFFAVYSIFFVHKRRKLND